VSFNVPQVIPGGGGGEGSYACPLTVNVGDFVYLSGVNAVDKASAAGPGTAAVGVVVTKPLPTSATVLFGSAEAGFFAGLIPAAQYFLDLTLGGITASVAGFVAGNIVQRVGQAKDATTLTVKIDNNFTVL